MRMRCAPQIATHFNTLMRRYDGKIDRWDVVTEPLSIAGGTGLNPNHFSQVLGQDYIGEVFRIAHAADPDAKLFLNESVVEYNPVKRQELSDLVSGLVAHGVPITGVGLELHEGGPPERGVIADLVDAYQALGLEGRDPQSSTWLCARTSRTPSRHKRRCIRRWSASACKPGAGRSASGASPTSTRIHWAAESSCSTRATSQSPPSPPSSTRSTSSPRAAAEP